MLLVSNMKFRHRVVAVVVLGFLTLAIYINLPDEASSVQYRKSQKGPLQLGEQSSIMKQWVQVNPQRDPEMCSLTGSGPPHHANISTYDLYYKTHFDVKSNGEWEMPVPTMSDYTTGRLPRLNVILVPHSHNDPGWLKTVNEYYTDQSKHILNNMVNKLTQFPNMTFIWTETVFFAMWWNELEDAVKVHVRRLIRRGQLEITLGGWVMPDEASSHYVSVIDQLIEGHQWLWENLHIRPENSWAIDPFGYSSTMAYLWQKSGMSNMVIQRVHQAVKASLFKEKALEFYWRQMWDSKGSTDIFCQWSTAFQLRPDVWSRANISALGTFPYMHRPHLQQPAKSPNTDGTSSSLIMCPSAPPRSPEPRPHPLVTPCSIILSRP